MGPVITARRLLPAVAVSGSALVVGCGGYSGSCGGSYGSSYGSCVAPSVDATGIYQGTLLDNQTQQQTSAVALIAENGEALVSTQAGAYYHLNVGSVGSELSGSYQAYSSSANFPNGSHADAGAIDATVSSAGLTGTLKDNSGDVESLNLSFDNIYSQPSSLPTLAGTWTYASGGFTLTVTIQANGVLSASDSNGCTYAGGFGIIDSRTDVYSVSYTRLCSGIGVTLNGVAAYFPAGGAAAPADIQLLADDGAGDYLSADLQQ